MITEIDKKGYAAKDFLINANDFGVLQSRKRIILIGYRKDLNITVPDIKPQFEKRFKVQSIFQDLPKLQAGQGKDKGDKYTGDTNEYLHSSHIRNGLNVLSQHVSRPHTVQDKEIYKIAVEQMKNGDRLNYINLREELKTHRNRHSFF